VQETEFSRETNKKTLGFTKNGKRNKAFKKTSLKKNPRMNSRKWKNYKKKYMKKMIKAIHRDMTERKLKRWRKRL